MTTSKHIGRNQREGERFRGHNDAVRRAEKQRKLQRDAARKAKRSQGRGFHEFGGYNATGIR